MPSMQRKRFDKPDETMRNPSGKTELLRFGDQTFARTTFEPGWRWSKDVKPTAGTKSCQRHHFGYVMTGKMHTVMDDGTTMDFGSGDVVDIPPGHDGWVVGNEAAVLLDFGSMLPVR